MCSNVNSRETCDGEKKKQGREKKREEIARTGEPKFSREAQAESRKKIQVQERKGEREKSERKGEYTRSRERGEERERMRKSLKLNIV